MKIILTVLCLLLAPIKAWSSTFAAPEKIDVSSAEGQKILRDVEKYLNSITTIKADFIQSASNGSQGEGNFYLSRPGKMRIDYKPPMNVEIVATGRFLVYHDIALEQVTYLNLESSPAGILLKENVSFNDEAITIKDITKFQNALEITVTHQKDESASITLVFVGEPFEFKQWRVLDAHNIVTAISLYDIEKKAELDNQLFRFVNPNPLSDRNRR